MEINSIEELKEFYDIERDTYYIDFDINLNIDYVGSSINVHGDIHIHKECIIDGYLRASGKIFIYENINVKEYTYAGLTIEGVRDVELD